MSFRVELILEGDGRLRAEEAVAAAVRKLLEDTTIMAKIDAFFMDHPNLRSVQARTLLQGVSRKRGARLIESGVFDSEESEIDPDRVIPRGRSVEASIPFPLLLAGLDFLPPTPSRNLPKVDVLFENTEWLAINKPHDLPSAPIRSDEMDSAVHRALLYFPELPVLRGNPLEPGLVHRLDNGTGGVLLFAKTRAAFDSLDPVWNTGGVSKIYRALTTSPLSIQSKRLDLRIGHDDKSKKRMRVQLTSADAKKIRGEAMLARTELISSQETETPTGEHVIDFTLRIETGLHHQIRATLAHFGAPILGDSVYGGAPSERVWLQAWKLRLPAIAGGSAIEIEAPLPAGWPQ